MKKKLLVISAVVVIAFISAPAFSQNTAPVNTTSSTAKKNIHPVKPLSASTATPAKQSPVAKSSGTAKSTSRFHTRVQPASVSKHPSVPAANNSAAKPFHARVKPATPAKSTPATQTKL